MFLPILCVVVILQMLRTTGLKRLFDRCILFLMFKIATEIILTIFFQHIRGALGGGDFKEAIEEIGIGHLFLVGGFSESPILQDAIREEFKDVVKVIIPQVTAQVFQRVSGNWTSLSIYCGFNSRL